MTSGLSSDKDGRTSPCYHVISPTGALGINNAKIDNDQRYIRAYCSDEDDSEHVWLYWIAGSSVAAIPFVLFGTLSVALGGLLLVR